MYLERNNLLHPHRGALLLAVDWIALSLDKGNVVCAAFIGLRKAFDSLDHGLLLQRIFELGVHGTIVEWFKDYLSNCYHRVKSSADFSSRRLMKGDTPGQCSGAIVISNLYEFLSSTSD